MNRFTSSERSVCSERTVLESRVGSKKFGKAKAPIPGIDLAVTLATLLRRLGGAFLLDFRRLFLGANSPSLNFRRNFLRNARDAGMELEVFGFPTLSP